MCQRWTIAIGTETLDDIWEIMNHETSTSLPYHDMVELRQQQGTILRRDQLFLPNSWTRSQSVLEKHVRLVRKQEYKYKRSLTNIRY